MRHRGWQVQLEPPEAARVAGAGAAVLAVKQAALAMSTRCEVCLVTLHIQCTSAAEQHQTGACRQLLERCCPLWYCVAQSPKNATEGCNVSSYECGIHAGNHPLVARLGLATTA